jgi:hypothetical protein
MNRVIVRSSHLLCALLAATLTAGGCTTTTPSGTDPSSSVTGAQGDTVIAASDQTREASGIAYYVIHADGSGTAFSPDGNAIATFRSSSDGTHSSFDLVVGDQSLQLDFALSLGADGSVTVEGSADGQPLSIAVSRDGQMIRWNGPKVGEALRPVVLGLSNDFRAYATAHSAARCAFGVAILGLSILSENPAWMLQGALAAYNACSG